MTYFYYVEDGTDLSVEAVADGTSTTAEPSVIPADNRDTQGGGRTYHNGDPEVPVFCRGRKERFTPSEAVRTILQEEGTLKCMKVPLGVRANLSFLVDTSKLKQWEDVKCDMNGVYEHVLRIGVWTIEVSGDNRDVEILSKKKSELQADNQYHLRINSKRNKSGLCRSIFLLEDHQNEVVNSTCLLQYHVDKDGSDCVEFKVGPHGNRKHGHKPYFPTKTSVIQNMQDQLRSKSSSAVYTDLQNESGGALGARQPSDLPRGKQQVYQIKSNSRRENEEEELLVYLRHLDEPPVLQHNDIPEDLWILGTDQMCLDLSHFCTSDLSSHPLSVDPTFNFGAFEVTPFTYRHLFLRRKRTGVVPAFIGPTAIHHSKDQATYRKIISAVTDNSPKLKEECKGFITDGETALQNALKEGLPKATATRCFRHYEQNCKAKLRQLGIQKQFEQQPFLQAVFGRKGQQNGILDAEDSKALKKQLQSIKNDVTGLERKFLDKGEEYESKFWIYLYNNRKMMGKCMTVKARQKAGMPNDEDGKPARCYSNQSESINNVLTRQKESITGNAKEKRRLTKLEFIRDVWNVIQTRQQNEVQLALCGQSDDLELADPAVYLQVEPDTWFNWTQQQRNEYATEFGKLTVQDVFAEKAINLTDSVSQESPSTTAQEFSFDLKGQLTELLRLDKELATLIHSEAEKLLNNSGAVQRKPSLMDGKVKYLVAGKQRKKGMYECTVHKSHVACTCQAFRYNNVCKHSLVVAQKAEMLREHLDFVAGSSRHLNPSRSRLNDPAAEGSGKKGGRNKNLWREPRRAPAAPNQTPALPPRPFYEVHHNDNPLKVIFLDDFQKAVSCRQCGVQFPRRNKTVPYDIVLSHEEKWLYPDPNNPGNKLPSCRMTVKFYCVKRSCVTTRFPYYTNDYLAIPQQSRARLSQSHFNLLRAEIGYTETAEAFSLD